MLRLFLYTFSMFLCTSFTATEKIVDVKVQSNTFKNWLEYEVYTIGEQNITIEIAHQNGKVYFHEDRVLYGEAYHELDATDFPIGKYTIKVLCGQNESSTVIEKI